MAAARKGLLLGNTITLESTVPPFEGRRVHVVIEPLEEEGTELSAREQARLWEEWVQRGPQGPIDDDEDPGFP